MFCQIRVDHVVGILFGTVYLNSKSVIMLQYPHFLPSGVTDPDPDPDLDLELEVDSTYLSPRTTSLYLGTP